MPEQKPPEDAQRPAPHFWRHCHHPRCFDRRKYQASHLRRRKTPRSWPILVRWSRSHQRKNPAQGYKMSGCWSTTDEASEVVTEQVMAPKRARAMEGVSMTVAEWAQDLVQKLARAREPLWVPQTAAAWAQQLARAWGHSWVPQTAAAWARPSGRSSARGWDAG